MPCTSANYTEQFAATWHHRLCTTNKALARRKYSSFFFNSHITCTIHHIKMFFSIAHILFISYYILLIQLALQHTAIWLNWDCTPYLYGLWLLWIQIRTIFFTLTASEIFVRTSGLHCMRLFWCSECQCFSEVKMDDLDKCMLCDWKSLTQVTAIEHWKSGTGHPVKILPNITIYKVEI